MSKILIVTGCDTKKAPQSENDAKGIYFKRDPKPCLHFMHKGTQPHEVGEKVKKKRPDCVVFEQLSASEIAAFTGAIKRKMNGSSPLFFQIGESILINVLSVKGHSDVLQLLTA